MLVEGCERGYGGHIYTMCSSLSAEGRTQQNAYQLVPLVQSKLRGAYSKASLIPKRFTAVISPFRLVHFRDTPLQI